MSNPRKYFEDEWAVIYGGEEVWGRESNALPPAENGHSGPITRIVGWYHIPCIRGTNRDRTHTENKWCGLCEKTPTNHILVQARGHLERR